MSLLLLTVICTPVAPAPAGIPAARTTSSKMATIFTSMPSTFYTVRLARTVLHLLRGDTGLDSDPDQLGPTSIAYIGWMVAVGSDELRSDRNLAPAGRVKIDQPARGSGQTGAHRSRRLPSIRCRLCSLGRAGLGRNPGPYRLEVNGEPFWRVEPYRTLRAWT